MLGLDAALEGAQELVRRVQRFAVLATDVPARRERVERRSVPGRETLIGSAVDQLQQLHGELDVAKALRRA